MAEEERKPAAEAGAEGSSKRAVAPRDAAKVQEPSGPATEKGGDQKRRKGEEAGPPTRDIVFSSGELFRSAARPFGMELDGALVVDLADSECAAVEEGVQIGWRILSVDGEAVAQEDEGVATRALRDAEQGMVTAAGSEQPRRVTVRFMTEEPEHWKAAVRGMAVKGAARRDK